MNNDDRELGLKVYHLFVGEAAKLPGFPDGPDRGRRSPRSRAAGEGQGAGQGAGQAKAAAPKASPSPAAPKKGLDGSASRRGRRGGRLESPAASGTIPWPPSGRQRGRATRVMEASARRIRRRRDEPTTPVE